MKDHILRIVIVAAIVTVGLGITVLAQLSESDIVDAVRAGNSDQVIETLQAQITADESYYVNYHLLGRAFFELGQYDRAAEQFRATLERKDKHYQALYYLARCYLQLEQLDEAEEAIKRGTSKAKKLVPQFLNAQGLLEMAREDFGAADVSFRRALSESEAGEEKFLSDLKTAPHSPEDKVRMEAETKATNLRMRAEFHLNLGDAAYFQKYYPIAVDEYAKALEGDTGSTEVYYHWAEACLDLKDYNCALGKLRIVLTKDSTYAMAWMRAGGIYYKAARSSRSRQERTQRYADAVGSYEKYLELSSVTADSSSVRVFFELAMGYSAIAGSNTERWQKAIDNFEAVLAVPIVPKDVYFHLGKALFWSRQYPQSADYLIKHMQWVTEQDEDYRSNIRDDELFRLLGDSYFYRKPKQYTQAVGYYIRSLEIDSAQRNRGRMLQNIAVAYHSTKSFVQAIEYYEKRIAVGIDSTSASLLKNAGYCALNIANGQGEDDDDDLLLEEFGDELGGEADFSGIDPDVNYYEVAIGYLNQYLEFKGDDAKAVQLVANTYLYQLNDCANGVVFFERLLALQPDNCVAKKSLGYAYFGGICNKDYTKALVYLNDAHGCFSKTEDGACSDKEIAKWIAQCYHLRAADTKGDASADYKKAWEWYGKSLKCDPTDDECKKGQDETRFMF